MTAAATPGARPTGRRLRLLLFSIAVAVVLVDQLTKQVSLALLDPGVYVPVVGQLAGFTLYFNSGAAFGMGSGSTWIFTLLSLAAFAGVVWASRRLGARIWAWGLGLLLGGLTGNLIDRLVRPPEFFHGAVVDFIDLHFFICNVADIAITGAAVAIIVTQFRGVGLDGSHEDDAKGDGPDAAAPVETASAQDAGETPTTPTEETR